MRQGRMVSVFLAVAVVLVAAPAFADDDSDDQMVREDGSVCPESNHDRTPAQVIQERLAAMGAGDLDRTMCTYANHAVVILPSGPTYGLVAIRAALGMMFQMIGGAPPLTSLNIVGDVALLTFSFYGKGFAIPDGADTYVIRHGYIRTQTVHDSIVFTGP